MNRTAWMMSALLACNGSDKDDPSPDGADADTDTDTDTDADTDSDTDPDPPVDSDGDGSPDDVDCDDADDTVFPGAPDVCGDDRVTDCDRTTDDGLVTIDGGASFAGLGEALATAPAGATVLVCPGTHIGPFTSPVAVNLVSHGGREVTVLDGDLGGTTLAIPGDSTITGFTVTRGRSPALGGGIAQTSPGTLGITDCAVRANAAGTNGGGVATGTGSTVTIADSILIENEAEDGGGGGLFVDAGTTVDLTGSAIFENEAAYGGGAYVIDGAIVGGDVSGNFGNQGDTSTGYPGGGAGIATFGDVALTDVQLLGNIGALGGGIGASEGTLTLVGVLVQDNRADGAGGGLFAQATDVVIDETSEVSANASTTGGGAYLVFGSVTGGLFRENNASSGGGVYLYEASLQGVDVVGHVADFGAGVYVTGAGRITLGSVVDNQANLSGGGVFVEPYSSVVVDSVVLTDNRAGLGGGIHGEDAAIEVETCTIHRNVGDGAGGGAAIFAGGTLSSVATDWGEGVDDNVPSDVLAGAEILGYGAAASFECTQGGCTPPP
jgi:hypothetical protein